MSAYTKTNWVDNSPPDLDAVHLNKIEQGIADAHDELEVHENASNPHGLTAADVGADAAGTAASAVSTHAGNTEGVHGLVKNNLSATRDPTATDDADAGYAVKSIWMNQTAGTIWQCMDATPGAAVWKNLTASGGGGGLWSLIQSVTISTPVSVVDISIPAGLEELEIRARGISHGGSLIAGLDMQVSTDGGATWITGSGITVYAQDGLTAVYRSLSDDTGSTGPGKADILGRLDLTVGTRRQWHGNIANDDYAIGMFNLMFGTSAYVNKLRFMSRFGSSYTIDTGRIEVFGR